MVATRETHASTSPPCCGLFTLCSNTPCPPDHRATKTSLSFHPFHGARKARRSPGHDGARQHAPDPSGLLSPGPVRRRGQSRAGPQHVRVRRCGRPGDTRGAANALCRCFGAGGTGARPLVAMIAARAASVGRSRGEILGILTVRVCTEPCRPWWHWERVCSAARVIRIQGDQRKPQRGVWNSTENVLVYLYGRTSESGF
jgi:hypothetical protein